MPQRKSGDVAEDIVENTGSKLSLDLVAGLAEPLARYMLANAAAEEWRDSPQVEALARVAALLEGDGREVPLPILDALRRAAEVGRPIGLA